jgi:hypothetical protein
MAWLLGLPGATEVWLLSFSRLAELEPAFVAATIRSEKYGSEGEALIARLQPSVMDGDGHFRFSPRGLLLGKKPIRKSPFVTADLRTLMVDLKTG